MTGPRTAAELREYLAEHRRELTDVDRLVLTVSRYHEKIDKANARIDRLGAAINPVFAHLQRTEGLAIGSRSIFARDERNAFVELAVIDADDLMEQYLADREAKPKPSRAAAESERLDFLYKQAKSADFSDPLFRDVLEQIAAIEKPQTNVESLGVEGMTAAEVDAAVKVGMEGDDEDDGCPKGDPDCTADDGDCHDSCSTFAERDIAADKPGTRSIPEAIAMARGGLPPTSRIAFGGGLAAKPLEDQRPDDPAEWGGSTGRLKRADIEDLCPLYVPVIRERGLDICLSEH
jgi:hypothetical protein